MHWKQTTYKFKRTHMLPHTNMDTRVMYTATQCTLNLFVFTMREGNTWAHANMIRDRVSRPTKNYPSVCVRVRYTIQCRACGGWRMLKMVDSGELSGSKCSVSDFYILFYWAPELAGYYLFVWYMPIYK